MGFELRRWLREELGHDIAGLPRAVALEIADDARNDTRLSFASLDQLALWTAAKNERVVRDAIQRLAAAGWEFRVPLGTGKDGRLVYAVPGRKLTFRVPEGRVPTVPCGPQGTVTTVPQASEGTVTTAEGTVVTAQGTVTTATAAVVTVPFSSVPQISSASPHGAAPDDPEPDGALFPPPVGAAQPRGTEEAAVSDDGPTAQTLLAEWLAHRAEDRPSTRIIGRVGKELKTLISEGIRYDDVRQGFIDWDAKGADPAALASFVNAATARRRTAQRPTTTAPGQYGASSAAPRQSTTDQRVQAGIDLAAKYAERDGVSLTDLLALHAGPAIGELPA